MNIVLGDELVSKLVVVRWLVVSGQVSSHDHSNTLQTKDNSRLISCWALYPSLFTPLGGENTPSEPR